MIQQKTSQLLSALLGSLLFFGTAAHAQSASDAGPASYRVQPGDVLQISVWKEEDMQHEVLVRPDGGLSFPLAGDMSAEGKSLEDLRALIASRLQRYIPDAVVTVAVQELSGNKVYVLGKVNNPGEFAVNRNIDVMQALSMAGGATPYASLNSIKILRRSASGQQAIAFRYADVEDGENLEQNIILQSGDVVVVP